jgi:hypothetical protein
VRGRRGTSGGERARVSERKRGTHCS